MSSTHPICRTTEWDDAQIKFGNYEPIKEEIKEEQISIAAQDMFVEANSLANEVLFNKKNLNLDSDDEEAIQMYRRKRYEELKKLNQKTIFGEVYKVFKDNYITEITEASKKHTIICHLYKPNIALCNELNELLTKLAANRKDVKICKGISDKIIPNYSDERLPTLLVYKKGSCIKQLFGSNIFNREKLTYDRLEYILGNCLHLFKTNLDHDPSNDSYDMKKGKNYTRINTCDVDVYSTSDEEDNICADQLHTVANDKTYSDTRIERIINFSKKF